MKTFDIDLDSSGDNYNILDISWKNNMNSLLENIKTIDIRNKIDLFYNYLKEEHREEFYNSLRDKIEMIYSVDFEKLEFNDPEMVFSIFIFLENNILIYLKEIVKKIGNNKIDDIHLILNELITILKRKKKFIALQFVEKLDIVQIKEILTQKIRMFLFEIYSI